MRKELWKCISFAFKGSMLHRNDREQKLNEGISWWVSRGWKHINGLGKDGFLFLVGESSYFLVFLSRATEKSKAKIPFDQASFKCPFFCAYFLLAEFLALISFYLLPIPLLIPFPRYHVCLFSTLY